MPVGLSLNELLDYTDWERHQWYDWLRQHGDNVLKIGAGPHGDGRFETVGQLVRHIFSSEKRYVERLAGRSLTDTNAVPIDSVDALFEFGQQSRKDLRELVETFPGNEWDALQDFTVLKYALRATPRKIVIHILMHEIRHWAQIATCLRWNGLVGQFHDFLFSPVLGGAFRTRQDKA
jgi:uncharacterized damage-inducible protein DinB